MSAGNLTKLFCDEGLKAVEGDVDLATDISAPSMSIKLPALVR